ncbi:SCO6745 family protein [Spirillospora sp. CA-128828]|uniref:SCO6745 family protein n=1 Tax=Spirillospora sp. CA-128828 TaxID=3240033 RepID=UPI003D919980
MTENPGLARQMWHQLEPLHALFWYSPEVFAEAGRLGFAVDTRWPSYFAWRAAPLGAAGKERVSAAFYSFSPRMVAEHIPAAWTVAPPERVLEGRTRAVDGMYRTLLGDGLADPDLAEAAALARAAAEAASTAGCPIAAANADLPWPDEPHLVLWHAIGILREQRGDGHVAALLTHGLDPAEALVSFAAIGAASEKTFASRGWTDEEWSAARDRLASRGLLDAGGAATEKGRELRDAVERTTDDLAYEPWRTLGADKADRLAQLTMPILVKVLETGLMPAENTLGIGKVQAPPR